MLQAVGAPSLDALIGETVPASIRQATPLDLGPGAVRDRGAGAHARAGARKNQVFTSLIGQGYYGTVTAAGDPAQHPGKPGLVHGLHALPAGDQPGPAGGAAQLPDHDLRSDRARRRQRLAARRGAPRRPRRWRWRERAAQIEGHGLLRRSRHAIRRRIAVMRTRAEPLGWTIIVGDPVDGPRRRRRVRRAASSIPARYGRVRDLARRRSRRCMPSRRRSRSSPPIRWR